MSTPKVVDNDIDEITAVLDGRVIRGWSYSNEAERRVKMLAAREFCEGWFQRDSSEYVIWSNEHRAWWAPDKRGYRAKLADAGRYSREDALAICIGARGGRRFNENPTEVPVLLEDALLFWPDDKPEWREERARFNGDTASDPSLQQEE